MSDPTPRRSTAARLPGEPVSRSPIWIALGVASTLALLLIGFGQPFGLALAPGLAAGALAFVLSRALLARTRPNEAVEVATPIAPAVSTSVADLFGQPVITLDEGLAVQDFTPMAKKLFPALERGRAVAIAVRDPDVLSAFGRALTATDEVNALLLELGGPERHWRVRVRRLSVSAPAQNTRILALLEDISEQRALERLRVDFIANASHELRTPLASLLGYIDTLQGPARNDPAAREKFLGIMREQAGRMARLINDLLSLSRAELRAHQPLRGEADLALAVREIVESLRMSASERGVTLNLDAPASGILLRADRDDLLRLSENLFENAIKYGRAGGKVDIAVNQGDTGVRLVVRDYGPGIAAPHIPRLTERFYRVDASHSRETGGTGLGLAIVKHIAARHGARLEIDSKLGEGATFSVTFPPLDSAA